MSRSYNDELQYLDKIDKNCWRIKKGFVPNMHVRFGGGGVGTGTRLGSTGSTWVPGGWGAAWPRPGAGLPDSSPPQVEGVFYVNDPLEKLMFEELRNACRGGGAFGVGGGGWSGARSSGPGGSSSSPSRGLGGLTERLGSRHAVRGPEGTRV